MGRQGLERKWIEHRVLAQDGRLSHLAERFNKVFLPFTPGEQRLSISGEGIEGEYRRVLLGDSLEVRWETMRSERELSLSAHTRGDAWMFYFSPSVAFSWNEERSGARWTIDPKRFVVIRVRDAIESMTLRPGLESSGVSLVVRADRMACFAGSEPALGLEGDPAYSGRTFAVTGDIRRALSELGHCPLRGGVRRLFLEAKALELIALAMDQASGSSPAARITRTERQALERVKALIDEDIACSLTIGELARCGHINECSLKRAFKCVYGCPIHGYILDRRMRAARKLLEEGRGVAETALCVGYGDVGGFTRAFRKKYGRTPGSVGRRLETLSPVLP